MFEYALLETSNKIKFPLVLLPATLSSAFINAIIEMIKSKAHSTTSAQCPYHWLLVSTIKKVREPETIQYPLLSISLAIILRFYLHACIAMHGFIFYCIVGSVGGRKVILSISCFD